MDPLNRVSQFLPRLENPFSLIYSGGLPSNRQLPAKPGGKGTSQTVRFWMPISVNCTMAGAPTSRIPRASKIISRGRRQRTFAFTPG
jgi:hypothetical protein